MWLRVEKSCNALSESGVFSTVEDAVIAARPGDTILISTGVVHIACNIQIIKPVCLVCGGLAIYQALESEWILLVT
jgi:hypothetical protein